jgi:hypothetical protein
MGRIQRVAAAAAAVPLLCVAPTTGGDRLPVRLPAQGFVARPHDDHRPPPPKKAAEVRKDALGRAKLWREPEQALPRVNVRKARSNLGPRPIPEETVCRFHPQPLSGTTPKFLCVFDGGEVLKVKYHDAEVHAEVAASRFLHAVGAGADRAYLVKRLRCFGCPKDPDRMLKCASSRSSTFRAECQPGYGETTRGAFRVKVDYATYVDFESVSVTRRMEGRKIEAGAIEGWGFDELDRVSTPRGATRAERDALRLLAVLLNHWDNRSDNQQLVCVPGARESGDGRCDTPFAYIEDVGSTFGGVGGPKGKRKLDVGAWSAVPIWKDPETCRVGVDSPRFHRATFGDAVITESGRRFLARRLARLTVDQIRATFNDAGFASLEETAAVNRDVDRWVSVFQDKVRQITVRSPCPTP